MSNRRVSRFQSLRTQLTAGAILFLVITVSTIGYLLTVHQRNVLTTEICNEAILQGRNIALTSEKFMLRNDPEFDLYPMIQRLVSAGSPATSVVIVDENDIIYGHHDLLEISKRYLPNLSQHQKNMAAGLRTGELLYDNDQEYLFVTAIHSGKQILGHVYLTYTKDGLKAHIKAALLITLMVSFGALTIGIILSSLFFRHVSRPMNILLDGVRSLDAESCNVRIDMPTHNEFSILADAFNDMSCRIDEGRRALSVKERMQRELELAREIQHSLLPKSITPPDGYDIDHYYEAAYEVGGDYVDVVALDEYRMAIAMGDVSGKGVQGLVVMAMVKTLFQQLAPRSRTARELICDLNASLYGNIKTNMFVTFLVALFDSRDGSLTLANAGHNPSLLYRHSLKTVERIRLSGPPLGVFASMHFNELIEQRKLLLSAQDSIALYTDGINESCDPDGHQFTIARIEESLRRHSLSDASEIVSGIVADTLAFRDGADQIDDVTLLVLKACCPKRATAREMSEASL